jgi:sortase (surface protein transpeptidase)
MPPRGKHTLASLVLGLVLLLAVPAFALQRSPAAVGVPPHAVAEASSQTSETPQPERGVVRNVTPANPQIATAPARLADIERSRAAPPVQIRIPSLDIDAGVVPAGVEPDGQMEIPTDVATAGWYRHGPSPGEDGSAVISSHVDGRRQGPGAFFDLARAQPGEEIEVELADGALQRFTIRARERLAKEDVPLDELFRTTGPSALVLVTCGGAFDEETRRYEDNVIVYAEPA